MLEEQKMLLEFFASARKEERTRAAAAQAVHAESPPRRPGRAPAYLHSPVGRSSRLRAFGRPIPRVARPLRATHHAPGMVKGATAVVVISSDERSDVLKVALIS
jgi:hypothetical protein